MKVFLLKDVERIGLAGEIIKVKDGFAKNYLFPRNLAVELTKENETFYKGKQKIVEKRQDVISSQTSMLAEKIASVQLTLARKIHEEDKLYGSVSPLEVVDLLAKKGISVAKNQVIFNKSIKTKGTFDVTIKLSSRLQPTLKLKVVAE